MRRSLAVMFAFLLLVLCMAGGLVACAGGPALVNALTPGGYGLKKDIAYADGPRHGLDIYVPDGGGQGLPVVVFLYGGAWQMGKKDEYVFAGQALASRGYVAVLPDYRIWPEARFPDFVEDSAAALAWTAAHVAEHGGDPDRIFLMGHSAGAYNAAMLALDPRWLAPHGLTPAIIKGVVGLAGPYDFAHPAGRLADIFGRARGNTMPIDFVSGSAPPFLLVYGEDDDIVRPGNSAALAEALRKAGVRADIKAYAGIGHIALVAALAAPLRGRAPTLADSAAFIDELASGNR